MSKDLSHPAKANRIRRVMVRFSEAEYQGLITLALGMGATRSKLVRKLVREALGEKLELVGQQMKIIEEGVYQLGALGRNVNQQLRLVHNGQVVAKPLDVALLEQVKAEILSLQEEWLTAIQQPNSEGTRYA